MISISQNSIYDISIQSIDNEVIDLISRPLITRTFGKNFKSIAQKMAQFLNKIQSGIQSW